MLEAIVVLFVLCIFALAIGLAIGPELIFIFFLVKLLAESKEDEKSGDIEGKP